MILDCNPLHKSHNIKWRTSISEPQFPNLFLNTDRETGLSTKETALFLGIESPMKHGLLGLVMIW